MIIGISGRIGSGKDTIGKIIQYLTYPYDVDIETYLNKEINGQFEIKSNVHSVPNVEIKKFAGKLKQIGSLLTGIPIEMFEDQEFKKQEMPKGWGMTYREFLQKIGTEGMRVGVHTNVWVNALFADYYPSPNKTLEDSFQEQFLTGVSEIYYKLPNWIITDMRFPNEMEAVVKRNGITIRVTRPVEKSKNTARLHPSETSLDKAKFDYEIINDGTMEELVKKVREILVNEELI